MMGNTSASSPDRNGDTSKSKAVHAKRNRVQLSCISCRKSKLRCDRNVPCLQCIKKGRAELCTIPPPPVRRKPAVSMQNRLKHLESLVKEAMSGETPPIADDRLPNAQMGTPDSAGNKVLSFNSGTSTEAENSNEHPVLENDHQQILAKAAQNSSGSTVIMSTEASTYIGATHWAAILENIEEVKEYFHQAEEEDENSDEDLVLFNAMSFDFRQDVSHHDLLTSLPTKPIVDRLISRFFNSNSPSLSIIHKPKFQKEYQKFWVDSAKSPPGWTALLFAMMVLATFAIIGAGETHPDQRGTPLEMVRSYRNSCVQALILSNYTKPGPYSIETLILHLEGDFIISKDEQVHLYLMVGNVVRLCLRMGLHRDPSKVHGSISAFEAEIRRRLWHHVAQIDMLSSFHLGLPGMIETIDSDTLYPRNLRDEDFSEDSANLPESRPSTELTPMSYLICKSVLCNACGKVITLANAIETPSYTRVLELDRRLHSAFENIPSFYRLGQSGLSIIDSPNVIVKKFSLFLIYHKSRCMLHRRHLAKDGSAVDFAYSRSAALDASMELLRGQHMTYEAAVIPGGPLANDKWFLSTLSMHDFLLAAMIVCRRVIDATKDSLRASNIAKPHNRNYCAMISALQKSQLVWENTHNSSSKKAASVLKLMLTKINFALGQHSSDNYQPDVYTMLETVANPLISSLSISIESTASISNAVVPEEVQCSSTSDGPMFSSNSNVPSQDESTSMVAPFDSMIDMPDLFDWVTFDNQIWPAPVSDDGWNHETGDLNFEEYNYNMMGAN